MPYKCISVALPKSCSIDKLKQRICDTMEHKALGGIVNPVIAKCSLLTPAIMGSSLKTIKEKNPPETTYEPMPFGIHFRYGITLGPVYDMEFGFPLCLEETTDPDNPYKDDETIDHLMEAMKYVVEESKKSSEGELMPLCAYKHYNALRIYCSTIAHA